MRYNAVPTNDLEKNLTHKINDNTSGTSSEARRSISSRCIQICLLIGFLLSYCFIYYPMILSVFIMGNRTNETISNLIRGAFLRILCDLTGGTPLECLKGYFITSTNAASSESCWQAVQRLIQRRGGVGGLWTGTSSRTIEGALLGAFFLVGYETTKHHIMALGGMWIAWFILCLDCRIFVFYRQRDFNEHYIHFPTFCFL